MKSENGDTITYVSSIPLSNKIWESFVTGHYDACVALWDDLDLKVSSLKTRGRSPET